MTLREQQKGGPIAEVSISSYLTRLTQLTQVLSRMLRAMPGPIPDAERNGSKESAGHGTQGQGVKQLDNMLDMLDMVCSGHELFVQFDTQGSLMISPFSGCVVNYMPIICSACIPTHAHTLLQTHTHTDTGTHTHTGLDWTGLDWTGFET